MDFLILSLATFRISSLIAQEDGPFQLFEWVRGKMGVKRDDMGEQYGTNTFAVGLICIWCNSVWVAFALTGLYMLSNQVTLWAAWPLALSAVALTVGEINKMLVRLNSG
jgi:hypothetical protein